MRLAVAALFLTQILTLPGAAAQTPTTTQPVDTLTDLEILERVDANVSTSSQRSLSRMIVVNRRGRKRIMKVRSWVVGTTKAFSEYLAPPKEKGTKMLKAGKNIWTYSPRADRVIHIAGHLLRQPIMGSDLSYEDSLEESELSKDYTPEESVEGEFDGRAVWIMTITAKRDDVAYTTKKLWIDRERFIPLREEWFGKSGKLLKTATVKAVERLEGRWYPTAILFKDELKRGEGTEFLIDEIEFEPKMPPRIFTKQSLRR